MIIFHNAIDNKEIELHPDQLRTIIKRIDGCEIHYQEKINFLQKRQSKELIVQDFISESYEDALQQYHKENDIRRTKIHTFHESVFEKKCDKKPRGFFNDCLLFRGDKQSRIAGAICWTMIAGNVAIGLFMIIYSCTR